VSRATFGRFLVSADGVTNRYAIRFVLIIYMINVFNFCQG
jgi:hypothetical protein